MTAAGVAVALVLVLGTNLAGAQQTGPRLQVISEPVIGGSPYVGATLTAGGGAWQSPDPARTTAWWEWRRCPRPNSYQSCDRVTTGDSYVLSAADRDQFVYLIRYVRYGEGRDRTAWRISAPTARISDPPAPAPTPVPSIAPAPTPTFDVSATATPVPTQGEVLQETARKRRVIRPFPVVRMRGVLTSRGARLTLFTVRAPRTATIAVRCKGRNCPAGRWSQTRSQRKSKLTRMARFERDLRAGVRLTVTVTRSGYVGKRTVFVIRRGAAPLRSDRCLSARGRVTKCPAGA